MNILGTDYSESNIAGFIESPLGERGVNRPAGIYMVAASYSTITSSAPTNDQCIAAIQSARANIWAIPFPVVYGVNAYRNSSAWSPFKFLKWDGPAVSVGGTWYLAEALNEGSSSPIGRVLSGSTNPPGGFGGIFPFLNPCCPGIDISLGARSIEVKLTKSLIVFGGANGSGSPISHCVPSPSSNLVCVFDTVRSQISSGVFSKESRCTTDMVIAFEVASGRTQTRRQIAIGPPEVFFGSFNVGNVLRSGSQDEPFLIRRMFSPSIPYIQTGSSGEWPPIAAAPCCNI